LNLKEALGWAKKTLEDNQVEGPKASAEFLLRQVIVVDRSFLIAHPEKELTKEEENRFEEWIERRGKHEPVWYITGKIEFYGQDFAINENVLIPRPETEVLLEQMINVLKGKKELKILDLGTGSGAIILTLAKELINQNNIFFASDISKEALDVARKNANNLGFGEEIGFKTGDLFAPWLGQKFDVIVTNLPYVPHEDMSTLAFDLVHYEPRTALDGGEKGLEVYRRFFVELPNFLEKNAKVFCEIGDNQGEPIIDMAKKAFPEVKTELVKDYAGHDRMVIIEVKE
jgi:release factor glutamine methyltransferase